MCVPKFMKIYKVVDEVFHSKPQMSCILCRICFLRCFRCPSSLEVKKSPLINLCYHGTFLVYPGDLPHSLHFTANFVAVKLEISDLMN